MVHIFDDFQTLMLTTVISYEGLLVGSQKSLLDKSISQFMRKNLWQINALGKLSNYSVYFIKELRSIFHFCLSTISVLQPSNKQQGLLEGNQNTRIHNKLLQTHSKASHVVSKVCGREWSWENNQKGRIFKTDFPSTFILVFPPFQFFSQPTNIKGYCRAIRIQESITS